jgi:HEPN domain-containing protein
MNRLRESADILFTKAGEDAQMLRTLLESSGAPAWGLGFHAQQSVEKAIKAVLGWHGIVFPYTHDLERLLILLQKHGLPLPPDAAGIPRLSPFGTFSRYGTILGKDEDLPERSWLLAAVQRTLDWAAALRRGSTC